MVNPIKKEALYEGKAKIVYKTSEEGLFIQHFKDEVTAFNKVKFAQITDKGALCSEISSILMEALNKTIKTHFVKRLNEREQLVKSVKIIPLEVVVRNTIAGSFAKSFGLEVGKHLKSPLVEFFYKKDELNDPVISPNQIVCLEIATKKELEQIEDLALKVNSVILPIFAKAGLILVDFKIEVGLDKDGTIIVADEISPDTCRLWDKESKQPLDKDVFRKDLGDISITYKEVLERLKSAI